MENEKTLILRGSTYALRRRVPVQYQPVEDRKEVWVSLYTDSLSIAKEKAQDVWKWTCHGFVPPPVLV